MEKKCQIFVFMLTAFLKYSTLVLGDIMTKELDIMPFKTWQQQKKEEIHRNKVLQERQEKIAKEKIKRSVKCYVTAGLFTIAIGTSVSLNVKNLVDNIQHDKQVEASFEPIQNVARKIFSENTNLVKDPHSFEMEPQYDHSLMAKDVENYASLFGKLQGDALLAAVLDISVDNAYQNDDRIISALSDEFTKAQTAQEYIHSLGYETQEEYLNAMKEAIYTKSQRDDVIQKYENAESELKR